MKCGSEGLRKSTAVRVAEEWFNVVPEGAGSRITYKRNLSRA
jgi:hypothetical protein